MIRLNRVGLTPVALFLVLAAPARAQRLLAKKDRGKTMPRLQDRGSATDGFESCSDASTTCALSLDVYPHRAMSTLPPACRVSP